MIFRVISKCISNLEKGNKKKEKNLILPAVWPIKPNSRAPPNPKQPLPLPSSSPSRRHLLFFFPFLRVGPTQLSFPLLSLSAQHQPSPCTTRHPGHPRAAPSTEDPTPPRRLTLRPRARIVPQTSAVRYPRQGRPRCRAAARRAGPEAQAPKQDAAPCPFPCLTPATALPAAAWPRTASRIPRHARAEPLHPDLAEQPRPEQHPRQEPHPTRAAGRQDTEPPAPAALCPKADATRAQRPTAPAPLSRDPPTPTDAPGSRAPCPTVRCKPEDRPTPKDTEASRRPFFSLRYGPSRQPFLPRHYSLPPSMAAMKPPVVSLPFPGALSL
jgi:hypothetical protein